ncbi:SCAN domain-containing protein 3 [Dictyocoela muelleri]|nr:SCAN domain-containing protein 3 [Dictyocoela muelleri]
MKLRFDDLLNLVIPKCIIDPFTFNVENVDVLLQKTLMDLQNDLTAKKCFENEKYNSGFKNKMTEKYPLLWEETKLFYIAFPSSYLVETGYSRVYNDLITHKRNRLDLTKRGNFRLGLSKIEPNLKKFILKLNPRGFHCKK